jgi:threonine/homoserine/homoserine lactone efflux protein
LIGISIAAPVGPIGVLCIRRTLIDGRWLGFISGLGAASADAVYGMLAAFGFTAITSLLLDNSVFLRLFGGAFLLYLGVRTFWYAKRDAPDLDLTKPDTPTPNDKRTWLSAYSTTFVLTITNPMTILAFVAIFAGLGSSSDAENSRSLMTSLVMVLGIFVGSAGWWLSLSMGVSLLRRRLNRAWLVGINRFSGGLIVVFALGILLSTSS